MSGREDKASDMAWFLEFSVGYTNLSNLQAFIHLNIEDVCTFLHACYTSIKNLPKKN